MEISQSQHESSRAVVLRCWHPAGNNPIKNWFMWGTTDKTCPISSLIFPLAGLHHIFSTSALAQASPRQHIRASGSGRKRLRSATVESKWTVAGLRLLVLRRHNSDNSKNLWNWTTKSPSAFLCKAYYFFKRKIYVSYSSNAVCIFLVTQQLYNITLANLMLLYQNKTTCNFV